MTETQTKDKKVSKVLLLVAVGALLYFALSAIANSKIDNYANTLQLQISEQQSLLATIATLTSRNGADEVTETIVKDCTLAERDRFDILLSRLNGGLAWAELAELERLFGRCGSFSAQRKSVMVARLDREIQIYDSYVQQLEALTSKTEVSGYQVENWKLLAQEEKRQSELFSELVVLQDRIISALIDGKRIDSDEMTGILAEVSSTQEALLVANKRAADLRSQLISL